MYKVLHSKKTIATRSSGFIRYQVDLVPAMLEGWGWEQVNVVGGRKRGGVAGGGESGVELRQKGGG